MLIIVPASGAEAYEHFRKTIEKPWNVNEILALGVKVPDSVVEKLRSVDKFHIWGCLPTVHGIEKVWDKIDSGWVVAFYREGYIVCYGVVFAKVRSSELAEKLWGKNKDGRTWEYIYFIKDLRWAKIPWKLIKEELGYKMDYPLGHLFVSDDRVQKIISKYGSILGFFESIEERLDVLNNPTRKKPEFKSFELYTPTLGNILTKITGIENKARATLYLYGVALKNIIPYIMKGAVPRYIIEDAMERYSARLEIETVKKDDMQRHKARLYNDFRRLCIISIDHGGSWSQSEVARPTKLGYKLAKIVTMIKDLGVELDEITLGALPILMCMIEKFDDCREDEAGVCILIARNEIKHSDTKGVVEEALKVLELRPEVLFLAIGYGQRIKIRSTGLR